jgi:uncharacterized protein YjcR
MTIAEKKEYAKLLYLKENMTQKEIAERVGVSERTMSKWVKEGNWEHMKTSIIITKEEQLRRIYDQIAALNDFISNREIEEGNKFANSKEADTLNKLAAAARSLETDVALADVIEVAKRLINWLRLIDIAKAQEVTRLFDAYIKDAAKRS